MRELMWQFNTANFSVDAYMVEDPNFDSSWCDAEDLAKIESGEYTVFGTIIEVRTAHGELIGDDSLWGSVYANPREFFTAHRDSNAMNRNCSIMRAVPGNERTSICHYFPDMVRQAIDAAREHAKLVSVLA